MASSMPSDPLVVKTLFHLLQRQIDATDGEIDRLVYDLYELTEEEIKIIEEGK
jgi:hypothetical protein